jgi:hypothetical protein
VGGFRRDYLLPEVDGEGTGQLQDGFVCLGLKNDSDLVITTRANITERVVWIRWWPSQRSFYFYEK